MNFRPVWSHEILFLANRCYNETLQQITLRSLLLLPLSQEMYTIKNIAANHVILVHISFAEHLIYFLYVFTKLVTEFYNFSECYHNSQICLRSKSIINSQQLFQWHGASSYCLKSNGQYFQQKEIFYFNSF